MDCSWPIGQILPHAARRFPDIACFCTPDGHSRSFREVNERVNRLADSLIARGVTRGTRIALLDRKSVV